MPASINEELDQRLLKEMYGVGAKRFEAYERLGVRTYEDLLRFYPRAYENRGNTVLLKDAVENEKNSIVLTVGSQPTIAVIRRGMELLKFRAFDESGSCQMTYFNQNYLKSQFKVGATFRFYGKVEIIGKQYSMTSPVAEPYVESVPLPPLVPVYRLTEGLSQKQVFQNVTTALGKLADIPDRLPEEIREKNNLCSIQYALKNIHAPENMASLARAKKRLSYEEMFLFALALGKSNRDTDESAEAPACPAKDMTPFLQALPFELTQDQKTTVEMIRKDMAGTRPMKRIVVGDVGCGKTVCAAAAIWFALQNGYQAALMVPTEILARQHYRELSPMFEAWGYRVELLIGSLTEAKKKKIRADLGEADSKKRVDLVIGTQALLSDGVAFACPGVVITDEQHRFGVMQRASLSQKNKYTHLLVMSATPIPRSLALVLYGDLQISRIQTMPAGRQRVDTFVVDESYRERLWSFVEKETGEKGQVYIVCPSIEEDEDEWGDIPMEEIREDGYIPERKTPLKAAKTYAEDLQKVLPNRKVAMVHGKMKAGEKDAVMEAFAKGEIDVLVSTTVIEVGINVPNAVLMIVENADRFGLSQLHQLRGRVGRGTKKSYCILVAGDGAHKIGEKARVRLDTMSRVYDGYRIAEQDLLLRGPGDFLPAYENGGVRQSGALGLSSMCDDADWMKCAFGDAGEILREDPELKTYPLLDRYLRRTFQKMDGILN